MRERLLKLPLERSYYPFTHSWKRYSGAELDRLVQPVLDFLRESTKERFSPELLVLEAGDYSLLHDDVPPEEGFVAFLDVSGWEYSWDGQLGIGGELFETPENSLLLCEPGRWFVKRVNHYATRPRVLVVCRSAS